MGNQTISLILCPIIAMSEKYKCHSAIYICEKTSRSTFERAGGYATAMVYESKDYGRYSLTGNKK